MKSNSGVVILILAVLILPLILPLVQPGFPVTDDGGWMIIRFSSFYQELVNGQFPVRWLNRLNHGYGYPVATFLYPGFMYIATPFKLIGFGFINSIKIVIIGGIITSSIFSYLWLKNKFDKWPAIVGSLLYIYNPYFVYDIYKRGSVGEILALAVVTFILYSISTKRWILSGIGHGLLIISHNTLALIFLPILLLYQFKKHSILYTLYSILLGLCLSIFFWLPALSELKLTVFSQTQVSHVLHPLWNALPLSKYIQFPFRLLSLLVVGGAYLSALITKIAIKNKYFRYIFVAIVVFLIYFQARNIWNNVEIVNRTDDYYVTNEATTTVQDEYMPVWVKEKPNKRAARIAELINRDGKIEVVKNRFSKIILSVNANDETKMKVNKIYWPGWKAYVNGLETKINHNNPTGTMEIFVPAGESIIEFKFGETSLRLIADIISLSAFIFILIKLIL